ncbi:MAG: hypothetical protein VXW32_08365 [Myxococcota bacterium]|nr:hypothetical protein [Myxococcota bacterium]
MIWLALGAALAAPHEQAASGVPERTDADVDVLFEGFLQFFEPESLEPQRRLPADRWHCGTGLVLEIQENWERFTHEQQRRMKPYISERPPLHELGPVEEETSFLAAPSETCFDAYPSRRPSWAGDGENRIVTEHFSVEWDGNAISESKAQSFADALEHSWEVEFDELGWRRPARSGQWLTLAYVSGGNYSGAVTSVESCGGDYIPFIVAGKSAFSQGTWYQDMAGHELNHASQFSYGYGHEFYFWESTATWIEEYLYPNHNAWSPYISGYSQAPHLAINKSSQQDQDVFYHMYGMAIFNFYLDEYVGGPELIEELWEYSRSNGTQYDLWIGSVLEDKGFDWAEIYDGFIAANAVMDYAESAYFPDVARADSVNNFPAEGGNSGAEKPEGYGQNYVRVRTGKASDEFPDLSVVFDGANSVEWSVQLVGERDGEVADVVRMEVVEGTGGGVFPDIGEFDNIWMVVSPLTTKTKAFNYSWEMELVDAYPDDEDTEGEGGGDEDLAAGCACATSSRSSRGNPGVLPLVALLLPWTMRRSGRGAEGRKGEHQ